MKEWKIGGIVSFSIVTILYGVIAYILSYKQEVNYILRILWTYPFVALIFVSVGVVLGFIFSSFKLLFMKPARRRGSTWISTVLYIAMGIVAMSIILSAGLPMINRMKERNTVIESKAMMHTISEAVSTVINEGPGSRRILTPVIIKGGKLDFDVDGDAIIWEMKTGTMLMEPCKDGDKDKRCDTTDLVQREGDLQFYLLETIVQDEYMVNVLLDYSPVKVDVTYSSNNKIKGPLTGSYSIAISNEGTTTDGKVIVGIYIG